MQGRFWRDMQPKQRVVGLALVVAAALAIWAFVQPRLERHRTVAPYERLVAQYDGKVDVRSYLPSLVVSVSFASRKPHILDLQPVLHELKTWKAVEYLELQHVSSSEFEEITEFASLRSLTMMGTSIADEQWNELDRLKELRDLDLWYTRITPAVASSIAGLAHLELLDLYGCTLPPDGFRFVAELHELKYLQFFQRTLGKPLDKSDIEILAGLPKLNYLAFLNTPLTEGALASLGNARALEHLEIAVAPINTHDLAPLAGLPKLRSLNLERTGITNDALATLRGSQSIAVLQIRDNPVDADGLETLRGIPSLKTIYVGVPLVDAARRIFPKLEVH